MKTRGDSVPANVIKMIEDYIVKAGRGLAGKDDKKTPQTRTIAGLEEDPQRLQEILDGMGYEFQTFYGSGTKLVGYNCL